MTLHFTTFTLKNALRKSRFLPFFLLLAASGHLAGQCNRIGWVASVAPGCGAKIIDLDNGELLKAVAGAEDLLGGKTIRFSADVASLPAGCSADGLKVVELTCISDTLPCKAQFGHAVSPLNSYRLLFDADIYDASTQFCSWTFGDGASATGSSVQHTFAHEGYFSVCLTVTDAYGCSASRCKNVFVSHQNPNWCDYDVQATAVGTRLFGKIIPVADDPGYLKSVKWFDSKTNVILGETAEITADLPGEGVYYICAQYEVASVDDGSICTTTRCQALTVAAPSCMNPSMVNTGAICPAAFVPVCACNGLTYTNECEALAAGVSKWWAGECGVAGNSGCGSDLDAEIVSGTPDSGYTVRFKNLSSGNYSVVQIDFGDGTTPWQGGPGDSVCYHYYPNGGIFRTNLSVWKYNSCVSSVTRLLVTDAFNMTADKAPSTTDYVLPGDANGDKKANVYDLLNLGLGFNIDGAPRPFATSAWAPQFAPNWMEATVNGVNFKHLDCDGNGIVNDFDRNAIEQHYTPIDTNKTWTTDQAPNVWMKFAQDTVSIDAANPVPLQIGADIMVGQVNNPVFNLYGLAFTLRYPEYINHDPDVYYSANSFFGFPNDILLLPKDNYERRQLDMGFARKYGQAVSGYGSIAKLNFTTDIIIIIDIIERAGSTTIPLTVPAVGIRAIDMHGNLIEMSGLVQDTLWVKLEESTINTNDPGATLDAEVKLFPNPATDATVLLTGDLDVEQVDVFNSLGQYVRSINAPGNRSIRLDTRTWSKGWYTLRVRAREGVVEKRLLVH